MGVHPLRKCLKATITLFCIGLLVTLSACQANIDGIVEQPTPTPTAIPPTPTLTPTPTTSAIDLLIPAHKATPTPTPKPKPTSPPSPATSGGRPALAFYYSWYTSSTWNEDTMPDLPTVRYNSSDDATIERQVKWAANAGLTGFISTWWGEGDQTDSNFARLLAQSAALKARSGYHFASAIYFECNAPALKGTGNIIKGLNYIDEKYSSSPYFFHWQGKPVIFFWDPLGSGRTLDQWASIRDQVDPDRQMVWSAEGVDTALLNVFDGLHLFSGGYWGLKNNNMTGVNLGFRSKIDAYNKANGTQKIWAAGIIPGYDDTRVPNRQGAYSIARNDGATYHTSWKAAIASNPEWITITSFNEWFEGSTIEPSQSYDMLYMNITRQYTQMWQ